MNSNSYTKARYFTFICCISIFGFFVFPSSKIAAKSGTTLNFAPVSDTISGIVNAYAAVNSLDCGRSLLLVDNPIGFVPGDKVLIIQMQGVKVITTNDANFGKVTDVNYAGNYEFNRIGSINGNEIQLRFELERPYDLTGSVQLVKVPEYTDVVTGPLTCKPWDGTTGGVLAISVKNKLTQIGDIDVSGKGFPGGMWIDVDQSIYHETGYTYPINPILSAAKGIGVAKLAPELSFGRGPCANAGGGGNASNAGGGGGAGAGNGGNGGLEYHTLPAQPTIGTDGLGGIAYQPNTLDLLTLGGGGGAGQANDQVGTSGGNGGGIVLIQANTIKSNGYKILADGQSVFSVSGNIANDGQGGGGGGGSILIDAKQVEGSLFCSVLGGDGGSALFYVSNQIIGAGGGGGGGKVLLQPEIYSNTTAFISGGMHGWSNQNLANGAQNGKLGLKLKSPIILTDTLLAFPFQPIELGIIGTDCSNFKKGQITVLNEPNMLFSNNLSPFGNVATFGMLTAGNYFIQVKNPTKNCTKDTLVVVPGVSYVVDDQLISRCQNDAVTIKNVVYTASAIVRDTTINQNGGCDTIHIYDIQFNDLLFKQLSYSFCQGSSIVLNGKIYTNEGLFFDTIPAMVTCDTLVAYNLSYASVNTAQKTVQFCPGNSVTLNGITYKNPGIVVDTIKSISQCDSIITYNLEFLPYNKQDKTVKICKGSVYTINGINYSQNAVVLDTVPSVASCDTIVTYNIQVDDDITLFPVIDTFLCPGTVLLLTNPLLDPGNGTPWVPGLEITQIGSYVFTGVNKNNCPKSINLEVTTCCNAKGIYVPNIFTPNDDGENDTFCVCPITACDTYQIRIYDRWGNLIYTGLNGNTCWDGTYKSKEVPAGVYSWVLEFKAQDSGSSVLKGSITVIR